MKDIKAVVGQVPEKFGQKRRIPKLPILIVAILVGSIGAYALINSLAASNLSASQIQVFGSLAQLRPDQPVPSGGTSTATITASKNEYESFQVLVKAGSGALSAVRVDPDAALTGPGGAQIPASDVMISREYNYNVTSQSDGEGGTGQWPDALIPEKDVFYGETRNAFPVDVAANGQVAAWVDVLVPASQAAGDYSGSVKVSTSDGASQEIPVHLRIANFAIPSTSSLASMFTMNSYTACTTFTGDYSCQGNTAQAWQYAKLFAEAGLNDRITISDPAPGVYGDTGGQTAPTSTTAKSQFQQYSLPLINGTDPGTQLSGASLTSLVGFWSCAHAGTTCLSDWKTLATQDGFANKFYLYLCDEPNSTQSLWNSECKPNATRAAQSWPGVNSLITTNIADANANGGASILNTIVPIVNDMDSRSGSAGTNNRASYNSFLSQAGNKLWLYTSCRSFSCDDNNNDPYWNGWPGYAIDEPASEQRAMGWMTYDYGATGELYYNVAASLPTAWTNQHISGGNGDGNLFYPGSPTGAGGGPGIGGTHEIPIDSIRLKRIRDGREDYEYLKILNDQGKGAQAMGIVQSLFGSQTTAMFNTNVSDTALQSARCQLLQLITGTDECAAAAAISSSQTPADTTPPTVSLTAPANNATVSGTSTTVSANASDDTGVAGVQFKLDGSNLNSEDTTAPYSTAWDTTKASNGTHTLTAVARDAAGNTKTSSAVTVTVNNSSTSVSCTKTQNSGESVSAFLTRLGPNAEGCLVAGTYNLGGNLSNFQTGQILHPAPAAGGGYQKVTLRGTLSLNASNIQLNDLFIVGVQNPQNVKVIEVGSCSHCKLDHLDITTDPPNSSFQGILNDADTTDLEITNNKIHNVGGNGQFDHGIYCHSPMTDGIIRGNWIYANAAYGIQFYPNCTGVDFSYNVLDGNGVMDPNCAEGSNCGPSTTNGRGLTFAGEPPLHSDNVNAHNNVLSTFGVASKPIISCFNPGTGDKLTDTLAYQASGSNDSCGTAITEVNIIRGKDPLYMDRAGQDYRLETSSPAFTLMGPYADATPGPRVAAVVAPPPDTTAPTVSFASPANNATVSGIVTATANASDDTGVTKVDLSLDGSLKMTDTTSPYNYSFDSKTLTNGNHTLSAKAYDDAGNSSSSSITVNVNNPDVTPPNAPTNVKATAANATTVNLSWSAATDTGTNPTGVVKYNVLRNGIVIAQPTTTTYTDTTAVANTSYSYTVQAVDGAGNVSGNSNTATVTTPNPPDTTPPTTPTNLSATAISSSQVNVTWSASTDAGGSGLAGYNVYRGSTKLNSTPVTGTSYGDSTVNGSTTYSYTVQAVDGSGNTSPKSSPATAITPTPPDATPPTVSLTAPSQGATVSGQVPLAANASDNTAVTKVDFYADGNLISTDTTAPYTAAWNATTAVSGTHTITAKAYDAAGNVGTASATVNVVPAGSPGTPAGSILFQDSFESGNFNKWNGIQALPGRASVQTGGAFDGSKYAHFEVDQGDVEPATGSARAEIIGPIFNEGQDIYVNDAIRVPSGVTFGGEAAGFWQIIQQIHEYTLNISPGTALFLDNNPATLRMGTGDGSVTYWNSPTLQTNQWYDLVYHLKISQDPAVGFIEIWFNGVPQILKNGQTRMYGQTTHENQVFLKNGIYRAKTSTGTSLVDLDDINIGTSYGAVAPSSGTPTPPPAPDTTAPTVGFASPTNNAAVSGIVTATANASDNTAVTKVDLSLDSSLKMTDTTSPYNYSFDSKTLANGNHTLTAKAYDAAGNSSTSTITVNVSNPDVTPPNAPTGLSATAASATSVKLSWSAATDTGANPTGVVKYNVLRNGVVIAQPTGTTYTDTSAVAKTAYSYTVQAVDGAGNVSNNSNTATVTTPAAPDTTAPTVPTNLASSAISANQVNVTWNASTDSGGSGLAGYNVYRNGTKLNSTPVTGTSYGDSTVNANTKYSYQVEAVDGAGNKSAQTAAVSVTTPAAPDTTSPSTPTNLAATATSSTQVNLTWSASTDSGGSGLAGYNVYRNGTKLNGGPVTSASYNDTVASAGTTYNYQIDAVDGAGNESAKTSSVSVTTPGAAGSRGTRGGHHHGGHSKTTSTAAVAVTVTDTSSSPVVGTTVTVAGQTAQTDIHGVAHFNHVASGKQDVAIQYNGKSLSRTVQVKSVSSHSPVQSFKVSTVQNKFSPALLLVPVIILAAAGGFIFRPWRGKFSPAAAQPETPPVVSSNHPAADVEQAGRKMEKPGTVYSPDSDKEETPKR